MQSAKLTTNEFFYNNSFEDYKYFSGIPYLCYSKNHYSSLAKTLSSMDNGDGVVLYGHEINSNFNVAHLQKFQEFQNCKEVSIIDTPVFLSNYIDMQTISLQRKLIMCNSYSVNLSEKFIGDYFTFYGKFYLYSLQIFKEMNYYTMTIRGYEDSEF